jgi:uncharacterized membrane protein
LSNKSRRDHHGIATWPSYDARMGFVSPFLGRALVWTLLATAVAITIVALMRAGRRRMSRRAWHEEWLHHRRSQGNGPGLHALDTRYTRGEIGRDDYQQRRAALLSPQPQSAATERTALIGIARG